MLVVLPCRAKEITTEFCGCSDADGDVMVMTMKIMMRMVMMVVRMMLGWLS